MAQDRIAVIGMAGRFPGARDTRELWKNLEQGIVSRRAYTNDELLREGVSPSLLDDPNYVKAGYPIDHVDLFDAEFFGMPPREAAITDPQQRLFLECVWLALEHAGYDPARYRGDIGLYAGSKMNSYLLNNLRDPDADGRQRFDSFELLLGNDKDYLTTRVSYKLNLKGPSVVIQTACSSSLVAIHYACEALINGDCDMAIAGGVSVRVPVYDGYYFQKGSIVSPDGFCRAYSDDAEGTVEGNGVGAVVLKRLEEAIEDGDHILAVVRGSAVNNDGSDKIGFTAPSGDGQMKVVAEAMQVAGVTPQEISLVEGHGTGTLLGDPIEVTALTNVYRKYTEKTAYCALASIKANIGHLDTAAGIASFIKTVLALDHKTIAPAANFSTPNSKIGLDQSPFYIPRTAQPWQSSGPRIAGITSLGIGGTNCHVIVEEAPTPAASASTQAEWHVLALSARSPAALRRMSENLAAHLEQHPDLALADVAWTLLEGRKAFPHRRAVLCRDVREACRGLLGTDGELAISGHAADSVSASASPEIASREIDGGPLAPEPQRLRRLAELWTAGHGISPAALYAGETRTRVPLPTYPFEYQSYWVASSRSAAARQSRQDEGHAEPTQAMRATAAEPREDGAAKVHYYVPSWTRQPSFKVDLDNRFAGKHVVLIHDDRDQAQRWATRLLDSGAASVAHVSRGTSFQQTGDQAYTIDPASPRDYERCFDALSAAGAVPRYILYGSRSAPPVATDVAAIPADAAVADAAAADVAVTQDLQDLTELWELTALVQGIGRAPKVQDVTLALMTRDTQDVLNTEAASPSSAILECFVKSVPIECPQITVKLLDADARTWDEDGPTAFDQLLGDVTTAGSNVIAYRNSIRWKKSLQAVSLPPVDTEGERAEQGGAYLITGGLGDIALELAEWLARRGARHLVLLARHDEASASALQARPVLDAHIEELKRIERRLQHAESVETAETTSAVAEGSRALEQLCAAYAIDLLRSKGELEPGREYSRDAIVDRITPLARFRKYVQFLIQTAVRAGAILDRAGRLTVADDFARREPAEVLRHRVIEAHPDIAGMVDLLAHCASHYAALFSGNIEPASVLYPDGTGVLLDRAYRQTARHDVYAQYGQLLAEYIALYRQERPSGTIRILEIGGGQGNLTKTLLPALQGQDVDYTFTDISRSFVRDAEAMAKGHGFHGVTFATLDITRDVEGQGFSRHSVDLVVGLDVVHATPDIAHTLRNVWSLVKDGGALGLVETTRDNTWLTMVMGVMDGWWAFHDDREVSPLLEPIAWQRKLKEASLGPFAMFPEPALEPRADFGADYGADHIAECSLMLIEKHVESSRPDLPAAVRRPRSREDEGKEARRRDKLQRLTALGAEVVLLRADVSDPQQLSAALQQCGPLRDRIDGIIHTAGVIDGKLIQTRTRQDIEDVLAPKVSGVQNLYQAFKGLPLSLWVNCSSVIAVSGAVGQLAHCAANQYLDDYTAWLRRHGQPNAVSINWEAWSEIGQAEQSRKRLREQFTERFIAGRGSRDAFLNWSELGGDRYTVYETTFSQATDWFLSGHRVQGRSVLPGTVFVEMAVEAAKAAHGDQAIELSDVNFFAPLFVEQDEQVKVLTILDRREQPFKFMIVSARAALEQAQLHVTGSVRLSPLQGTVTLDLADLERRCADTVVDARVERNDARWQCLSRASTTRNMGLAEVTLPEDYSGEAAKYHLHPAVLDVATAFLSLPFRDTSAYIPVGYKKITVFEPLPSRIFSFARMQGSATAVSESLDINVTLLDSSGKRLVQIENLTLRRVPDAADVPSALKREAPELQQFLQHVKRHTSAWLTPAEGVDAFGRILASGLPRVVPTRRTLAIADGAILDEALAPHAGRASKRRVDTGASGTVATDIMKDRPALRSEYISASNRIERELSEIYANVLGIREVGIEDNFFELGGDSMLSIQVSSMVNDRMGVEVPSGLLFEYPTIRKLAGFLQIRLDQTDADVAPRDPAMARTDDLHALVTTQNTGE
jgi:acyl transferase domain-containing protein/acyl carrier protein